MAPYDSSKSRRQEQENMEEAGQESAKKRKLQALEEAGLIFAKLRDNSNTLAKKQRKEVLPMAI